MLWAKILMQTKINHNMNRITFFGIGVFTLWIFVTPLMAQSGGCGTVVSEQQKTLEDTITINLGTPTQSLPLLRRNLLINVFVVKNKNHLPGISVPNITNAVASLNASFASIGLTFSVDVIHYIDNYQFDALYAVNNMTDLMVQNTVPNTINMYLVSGLFDQYGIDVAGLTYMPGDSGRNAMFIKKGYLSGSNLLHQMGHFLNLYDTHERDAFGPEKVARINCDKLGDRLCDTDADPNLEGLINSCVYIGTAKDADKQLYSPSPRNIMSFTADGCRCNFTRGQYLRMAHCLRYLRPSLH